MLTIPEGMKIYLSLTPVDMRKSINGLSVQVVELLDQNPQCGHLFLFHNRSRDKVKILVWDKNGFILVYKQLEKGRFKFPTYSSTKQMILDDRQLEWLLCGLDFSQLNRFPHFHFKNYA